MAPPGRSDPFVPRNQRPARAAKPYVPTSVWAVAGIGLMALSVAFVWWRIREDVGASGPQASPAGALAGPVMPSGSAPPAQGGPTESPVAADAAAVAADPAATAAPAAVTAPGAVSPAAPAAVSPIPAPTPSVAPDPTSDPAIVLKPEPPPKLAPTATPLPSPAPSPAPTPVPAPSAVVSPSTPSSTAEASGLLRVTTNAKARVKIDGKSVGTILEAADFSLPGGEHKVVVTAYGTGKTQTMLVRIDPGRSTQIAFQLK